MLHDRTCSIPPEIIAKIFGFVLSNKEVVIPNEDDKYPWTLGHVCSRWRQIIWDTPSFWNKIRTRTHLSPIRAQKFTFSDALGYILAKITGPISLIVWKEDFGIVLEHFDRFSELSIIGLGVHQFSSILGLPTSAFAHLESLLLILEGFYGCVEEHAESPLETAPNLRRVEYRTFYLNYIPALFQLPWATLESIKVMGMHIPPNVIFDIFQFSPLLKSCSLRISNTLPFSTTSKIFLPALEVLNLETGYHFDWNKFLSLITAPFLTSLTLTTPNLPCVTLASLITRSCCSLLKLDVSDPNPDTVVNYADVELLFDTFPSVTSLCVPWPIPPSVFKNISDGALPELARAEFRIYPPGLGGFIDMMDSYAESPPRPFSYFKIACLQGPEFRVQCDRYLERYEKYKGIDGLEIVVISWDDRSIIRPPEGI